MRTSASGRIEALIHSCEQLELEVSRLCPAITEVFYEWQRARAELGEFLIDQTISEVARQHRLRVIASPVKRRSYSQYLRMDTQCKAMMMRSRVEPSGLGGGFIDWGTHLDEGLKSAPLSYRIAGRTLWVGREDEGGSEWLEYPPSPERAMEVAAVEAGVLITSDIDLVCILSEEQDAAQFWEDCGYATVQERCFLQQVNKRFQQRVVAYGLAEPGYGLRPLQHGAFARFSRSRSHWIKFPLKVYLPEGLRQLGSPEDEEASRMALHSLLDEQTCLGNQGSFHADFWSHESCPGAR